jgi:23S rRNA maturation-related 3'-5' exoribonuclease YhaM
MKQEFIDILSGVDRAGIPRLIEYMEEYGFFRSPCSGGNHLAKQGGLVEHSMNVLHIMQDAAYYLFPPEQQTRELIDSIIITALLHDLGKLGDYGKPGYVPNYVKGKPTKADPTPEPVQSTKKPFEVNKDLSPVDHEVRSVKIATKFIRLTEDEELAILWHNGLYGNFKYQIQGKETPLYLLLHNADMWASRVVEKESEK